MRMSKCRVCQRDLRTQESVDRGVGPTCAKHLPHIDMTAIRDTKVRYWIQESYEDISTAYFLMKGNKKLESAFFAHLASEKAVKSLVTQNTQSIPQKIHDLIGLSQQAQLSLSVEQQDLLSMLNGYEIEERYPVERQKILSRTTDAQFGEILEKASEFIQWCTQQIK